MLALIFCSFFSCADISNKSEPLHLQFSNFSKSATILIEDETPVSLTAKLYTRVGQNHDLLIQEQHFQGPWKDFSNNFQIKFEEAQVWHDCHCKVTVTYFYPPTKQTVTLQGRTDTIKAIRGNNETTVTLNLSPTTQCLVYTSANCNLVKEDELSTLSLRDFNKGIGGPYFCFTDSGKTYYAAPALTVVTNALDGGDSFSDLPEISAIKSSGDDVWALFYATSNATSNIRKLNEPSQIFSIDSTKHTTFEIKRNNAYFATISNDDNKTLTGIKRFTLSSSLDITGRPITSATQTGYIDITPRTLGINATSLKVRDMLIQDEVLFLLINEMNIKDEKICRGGVIKIPLSSFDSKYTPSVANWYGSVKVLGWYSESNAVKKTNNYFYAPARFIARKPDELVIADDGFFMEWNSGQNKMVPSEAKRIIFLDLDTLSMRAIDLSSSFFKLNIDGSGGLSYTDY